MNKIIFSLVCIVLYVILAVSIHCSEQKVYGVRSRIIRAIKKMNKSEEKNCIKFKCKAQLNNNNNKNEKCNKISDDYEGMERVFFCCCLIPKESD
ncbi:fam-c protein [Plasmodium yoelii]|uniref:Fam-c protein n=2 Tax=Plasmodium yoelii TaxID=5861 RepID=A0AAE9X253_PLAYO|nr:fam-c protein [Plasmodium yoelii]WBY60473.1 fam-c protein [Plasmodium yoelii yoelii]CDU20324.1 fam-c protein [Plasmodium yoelii]VTZ81082.1 fam-c protein [Plasmodium yoelii]|eukprot:XP_022813781.1 fam-c protein [Plasmodium yoelii]